MEDEIRQEADALQNAIIIPGGPSSKGPLFL